MELVAVLVLVLSSGFYSGTETAVYRAHWVRLTDWANRKAPGARLALRLLNWREPSVIATLVGTNLCNVFASMLASEFVASRFGTAYTGLAVVAVVALTMVFGEFMPKAYAAARPNRWLQSASVPLAASLALFAPAVLLLEGIARVFAAPFVRTRARLTLTRQDFLSALRQRESRDDDVDAAGYAAPTGQPISSMVARLFKLSGAPVAEARIPIDRVTSVSEDAGYDDILRVIEEHGYSRIPVFRGERSLVIGVVLAKDLLAGRSIRVRDIGRVKESARAMEVLDWMQRRGEHIALVTDDSDQVTGLVTLEDILEELVGEIRSED